MSRRARVILEPATGESDRSLGALGLLFAQVLQEIPIEQADELAEAFRNGKVITVAIVENPLGSHRKCAFQWEIAENPLLRQTNGTA